ncbi:hypothetical protein MCOR29_004903 [Pyricularia oryzae]|uniref:Beta-lactamase-related domain-containing protein n=1 Tax=Pyricularia grisea TaxID=148305 RepID=A0ABQ8NYI2_PYRGI|nr:hypothetical protein MCOR19_007083 [Pyricularia oryzae]KAI6303668.1 hypothetical protein MCOR33_001188 [Pyricularia grisea]KAI6271955.1 hypothetical protein MCOR26_007556 [Pyricularia oryzae]KAI6321795.1 hypothetical protein MCOR29_004903 [Pyricularia oryzae]KAI6368460.1 hypothetical protein MCOR32_006893 [Pyricularia oryzae]
MFASVTMRCMSTLTFLSAALLVAQPAHAAVDGLCPIIGAVLPPPVNPGSHPAVDKAIAHLQSFLETTTSKLNVSSVSVAIKSIHEDKKLLDFHSTPPTLDSRGVKTVDGKSIYRVGSISKIFPVLAVLKLDGVSLDDKITKYLPELRGLVNQQPVRDSLTEVEWDEITLGALGAHISGISTDYVIDYASFPGYVDQAVKLGLPGVKNITSTGCAGIPGTRPCEWEDFFKGFGGRAPVFAPFSAPAYSNIGTPLLALVVEKVSKMSYEDFLTERILAPLGLNSTGSVKPEEAKGVIPKGDFWFGTDTGFETPAGGLYSSSDDMIAFADAVLSNKVLSPAQTRKWLKPLTNTASLGTQLGAPWEIFRAINVTRDQRAIEVITKGGDLFNYRASMALVPDYGLAMTVLVSGDTAEMGAIVPSVQATAVEILLPALERAGKDQAAAAYAGRYTDEATNSTILLEVDPDRDDGPGIRGSEVVIRGFDVLKNYALYDNLNGRAPSTMPLVRLRMQPTEGLSTGKRQSWRGVWNVGSAEQVAARDAAFPWAENGCITWASTDRLVYGLQALDRFIFNVEPRSNGMIDAQSLEFPAFQVKLVREKACKVRRGGN